MGQMDGLIDQEAKAAMHRLHVKKGRPLHFGLCHVMEPIIPRWPMALQLRGIEQWTKFATIIIMVVATIRLDLGLEAC